MSKLVLVVDDEKDIREVFQQVLELEGYRVSAVKNGKEALEWLRNSKEKPSLILLDLMMPVMDGYEFLVELRSRAALAAIPIVIITAAGNARGEAAKLGAAGHLQKPFKLDELLATIERIRDGASTTSAE